MTKVYGSNVHKVNHMFTCGVEGGHGVTVADHANPLLGLRLRHPLLPRLVLGLERFNHFCELSIHDQFSILELILLLIKFTHFRELSILDSPQKWDFNSILNSLNHESYHPYYRWRFACVRTPTFSVEFYSG